MNAALRLGLGDTLDAMCTGLELQAAVHAAPFNAGDDLLEAAVFAGAVAQDSDAPTLVLGVARVHPVQVAGEQGRLVAARAGADLEEDVAFVVRILGDQQGPHAGFDGGERLARVGGVLACQFADRLILIGFEARRIVEVRRGSAVALVGRDHRLEFGILARQRGELVPVRHHFGVGE